MKCLIEYYFSDKYDLKTKKDFQGKAVALTLVIHSPNFLTFHLVGYSLHRDTADRVTRATVFPIAEHDNFDE